MKKLTLLILLSIYFKAFSQEGINFQETLKFSEILAKAKQENKLVFVDAFASWCGPCKLMAKNVFSQKEVGDYFNANFINAKFDMEKGEGRDLAARYTVRSYPTYLFLNGDGEVVSQNLGYMDAPQFIAAAKIANNPSNKGLSLKERFSKGEANPDFLFNIARTYAYSDYDFAKKASERYFLNKKNSELTGDDVSMLLFFLKSSDDPNYKVFLEKKDEIQKFLPRDSYDRFSRQVRVSSVMDKAVDMKKKSIDEGYFLRETTPIEGAEEARKSLSQLKINFYSSVGNFPEFEKAALAYYQDSDQFDATELLKVSAIFADKATSKSSLAKAMEWAQKSLMHGENSLNTAVLSRLYDKMGDPKNAKDFEEMSKKLYQQESDQAAKAQ